jgi:hypothetical protein
MKISTSDIRAICDLLLDHLERQHGSEVEITVDYYWHIDESERSNINETPSILDMGQLSEDWQNLEYILKGDQEPIGYALTWLAEILRTIGEVHVS